jgi:hypothetical protein
MSERAEGIGTDEREWGFLQALEHRRYSVRHDRARTVPGLAECRAGFGTPVDLV